MRNLKLFFEVGQLTEVLFRENAQAEVRRSIRGKTGGAVMLQGVNDRVGKGQVPVDYQRGACQQVRLQDRMAKCVVKWQQHQRGRGKQERILKAV